MKKLKTNNLINCDLYTTLEPCIMCSGAIIEAKIKRVFVGAHDTTKNNIGLKILIDNKIEVYDVICMEESKKLLDLFFENLRNTQNEYKVWLIKLKRMKFKSNDPMEQGAAGIDESRYDLVIDNESLPIVEKNEILINFLLKNNVLSSTNIERV
jgi:hypothetical protein